MKITIAEPVLVNTLEQFEPVIATETRSKLKAIFLDKLPEDGVPDAPLSKEALSTIKADTQMDCEESLRLSGGLCDRQDWSVLRVLGAAAGAVRLGSGTAPSRDTSYRMEFAMQWAKAHLFQNKLPMPSAFPTLSMGALQYPQGTCANHDYMLRHMRVPETRLLANLRENLPDALLNLAPESPAFLECKYQHDGTEYSLNVHTKGFLGTVYTEGGTAWFAGFLSADDVLKLRFRRMRLGAAVKERTGDDTKAQKAADIRAVTSYDFVLHPNDRPFGVEYFRIREEGGPRSCMSGDPDEYAAPYGVHPCDVYSTAHYGQGDNGLVLVEAQNNAIPVARGILDVNTGRIVRWYGEHKARTTLTTNFNIQMDADLEGVRLALIECDGRIAAPYLDGSDCVTFDDGFLYVDFGGDISMNDTSGYAYIVATRYCVLSDTRYPEDDLIYQSTSDTWFHPDNTCDGYLCPIIQEYLPRGVMSYRVVEGEEDVLVSDAVAFGHYTPTGWTNLRSNVGWTQDEDSWYWDEDTEQYYNADDYNELLAARKEEEDAGDEDAA